MEVEAGLRARVCVAEPSSIFVTKASTLGDQVMAIPGSLLEANVSAKFMRLTRAPVLTQSDASHL